MWLRIDFYFNVPDRNKDGKRTFHLNERQLREFKRFLRLSLESFKKFVNRRFFLFEPRPHCFLAIELQSWTETRNIQEHVKRLMDTAFKANAPKFVICESPKESPEENNGPAFLNFMTAATMATLYPSRKKYTGTPMHLVHCYLNQLTNSRAKELEFYRYMKIAYTIKKKK